MIISSFQTPFQTGPPSHTESHVSRLRDSRLAVLVKYVQLTLAFLVLILLFLPWEEEADETSPDISRPCFSARHLPLGTHLPLHHGYPTTQFTVHRHHAPVPFRAGQVARSARGVADT